MNRARLLIRKITRTLLAFLCFLLVGLPEVNSETPLFDKGSWSARASASVNRTEVASAGLGGKIYVVGGFSEPSLENIVSFSISRTVEVYDPVTDSWSTSTSLPVGLHHAGIATLDDKLYVIGGFTRSFFSVWHPVATIYQYDLHKDEWVELASMPTARGALGVTPSQGRLYAIGGFDGSTNGDGLPNLLVSEWTGGAHCCFLFHIFEIGNRFRHIQTINAVHSGLADFANLDEDPALEFQMVDWTFAYWRTSFAASPAPAVILKYQGQQYEMASDLMRKTSLSFDQFIQLADEIKSSSEWESKQPPVRLWAEMLDLIYTGRMDQAWDLVDASWPKAIDGKEQFVKDLQAKLRQSPFWKDVQELNRGKA